MYSKARVLERGYLGKHSDSTMTYTSQVMIGSHTNTSIAKWIHEYDETIGDCLDTSSTSAGSVEEAEDRVGVDRSVRPSTESVGTDRIRRFCTKDRMTR